MNRRYAVLFAVPLALALTGCKTTETTAMTATSQIILTPTPSIPDAQTSSYKYKVTADVGALVVDAPIGNITITGRTRPGIEVHTHDLMVDNGTVKVDTSWDEDGLTATALVVTVTGSIAVGDLTARPPRRNLVEWLRGDPRPYTA